MSKTITVKTKLWGTKVFDNATFTRVGNIIEIYQKSDKTTISYFMINNIISLTY